MKKTYMAVTFALALGTGMFAGAADGDPEKLELKDGGMLFLHADGTSRMVDAHGRKTDMADGMEMELKDGRMVMMKNKKVWMRHGPPGKGHEGMVND